MLGIVDNSSSQIPGRVVISPNAEKWEAEWYQIQMKQLVNETSLLPGISTDNNFRLEIMSLSRSQKAIYFNVKVVRVIGIHTWSSADQLTTKELPQAER